MAWWEYEKSERTKLKAMDETKLLEISKKTFFFSKMVCQVQGAILTYLNAQCVTFQNQDLQENFTVGKMYEETKMPI